MIRKTDTDFALELATNMLADPTASDRVAPWVVNIAGLPLEEFDEREIENYDYTVIGGNHSLDVRRCQFILIVAINTIRNDFFAGLEAACSSI
jgi:hypothetical protein